MPATSTRTTRHSVFDDSYATDAFGTAVVRPKAVQLLAVRTGEVLPKYKQRIKDQLEATTAMTAYTQSARFVSTSSLSLKAKPSFGGRSIKDTSFGMYDGNGYSLAIPVTIFSSMPSSTLDRAKAEAIAVATRKIKEIQSPFDTQVFAAELHDVKGLLTGPLSKYSKLLTGLYAQTLKMTKNGRLVRGERRMSVTDIAEIHLELQFGVIPLIRDISDIMKVLDEKASSHLVERVKAFGKADYIHYDQWYPNNERIVGRRYDFFTRATYTAEYFIRSGIAAFYQERAHGFGALSSQLLDIINIPVTLWETTPYSFLLDYFVNVGDVLASTTRADSMVSWTSQTAVQTYEIHSRTTFSGYSSTFFESCTVDGAPFKEVKSKVRKVTRTGGSIGIPPLTVTLPGSMTRYANIAALLFSKLDKRAIDRKTDEVERNIRLSTSS